jgi:hypothetical protein
LEGEIKVHGKDEKLINANLCINLAHSNAGKHTVKRKSEYITAQDPDEETKEDGLSQHQIKISITDEE